jgi:lipoprotein-releasing system ATP-binding protein
MEKILVAQSIYKSFGHLQVLKDISLEINKGEVVTLVGASGAGKSTLLHILGTLDKPDQGSVQINQQFIHALTEKELAVFRNTQIGFIFQFHNLLNEFTALENITLPARIGGFYNNTVEKKALEILDFLKLSHRASHFPSQMSGGEQQRVAVARALINQPKIIFADEPSGNLDTQNAHDLHALFFDLKKTFHQTFVIVTHNESLANLSDRKVVMKDGLIVSEIHPAGAFSKDL